MPYLKANWSAPNTVHAYTTTRKNGVSQPPYDGNNLANHVGDDEQAVAQNRIQLIQLLNLPAEPVWLEQIHSNHCVIVENESNRIADASITRQPNTVLAIMTADCLPIVICNSAGTEIAAIHAGWRGLANGVIEESLLKMQSPMNELLVWIGPAICHRCYETGEDVQTTFVKKYPNTNAAFKQQENKLHANLPQLAEIILKEHGVKSIYQSNQCTFEEKDSQNSRYYSYRRAKQTGRITTLIWFN